VFIPRVPVLTENDRKQNSATAHALYGQVTTVAAFSSKTPGYRIMQFSNHQLMNLSVPPSLGISI
jgi:hypothetical protein